MIVELIPVIEISYNNQGVPTPEKYPYWNYPNEWDNYHKECLKRAGFSGKFVPYLPGFSLYRLPDIEQSNLIILTKEYVSVLMSGRLDRNEINPFSGGYILRINNQDIYFPQCCGDLSDIKYWSSLVLDKKETLYSGHPEPRIRFSDESIIFDFNKPDSGESFVPPPPVSEIIVDISLLKNAIEVSKKELYHFCEKLDEINVEENLNIYEITKLLVWGN